MISVTSEGMGRTEESERLHVKIGLDGEPESERAAVGVADDNGAIEADGLGKVCDEAGERFGAHVEFAGRGLRREDVDGHDTAIGGEVLDEFCEGFGGSQKLMQEKQGWAEGWGVRLTLDVSELDAGDGHESLPTGVQ